MTRILKLELRKAFFSPLYLISLLVSLTFVLISAYYMLRLFYGPYGRPAILEIYDKSDQMMEIIFEGRSLYTGWIGAEINSPVNLSFFFLLPLLAMLPCGLSLASEIKTGYTKLIIPRCGRKNYILAKLISAFLSGGSVIALSLIFSVLFVALFLPAITPKVINSMYFPVLHGDIFSTMAYSKPMLFIICYIGLDFIFGGLFACLPVAAAYIVTKSVHAVLGSFLLTIVCSLFRNFFLYLSYIEVSPIYLMRAVPISNSSRIWMVVAWFVLYSLVTIPFAIVKGVQYEIV